MYGTYTHHMGYGYGIWLVYDGDQFVTPHIGHVTVACFMQEENARRLYADIRRVCPSQISVQVTGAPESFPAAYYARDTNKMHSWGYNCTSDKWPLLRDICVHYDADFSPQAHTSIEYGMDPALFSPVAMEGADARTMECDICLVDIRSDFPVDWRILL
jgi:hypothetical protein